MKNTNSKTAIYIRTSTDVIQTKGRLSQRVALLKYCNDAGFSNPVVYEDKLSGKNTNRPAFQKLQADIFHGRIKTVITWKLDRISRSLTDGINILGQWCEKQIRVISVSQQIDFNGTVGKMIASILFGLAEMERQNISENIKRGLAAAKNRGVVLGKKQTLFVKHITPLLKKGHSVRYCADKLNCTPAGIYRVFAAENVDIKKYTQKNKN